MAITPMQLPSPKAFDPNQMEMTNLQLFKDPYTASGASVRDSQLQLERQLAGEQYSHAVQGQQDYYNRALQAQAQESMVEAIPKFLHETHGIGIMSAVPEIRRMLESMPAGMYDTYLNQSLQGEKAKALQAGGAGAYSAIQAGLATPPSEFAGATGVNTQQVTPLALQIEGMQQAGADRRHAASEEGSTGGSMSVPLPPIQLPDGRWVSPTYSVNKKVTSQDQWMNDVIRKGGYVPRPATGLPPNQQPNQQGAPTGQQGKPGLPPQEQRQGAPGGRTPAAPQGGKTREQYWDQTKQNLPAQYKPAIEAVERARRLNGGKIVIENGIVIGNDPTGKRVPIGPA